MEKIRNENQAEVRSNEIYGATSNQYTPLEEREFIPSINPENAKTKNNSQSAFTKRIKKGAGILTGLAVVSLILSITFSSSKSVDTSEDAANALEDRVSTSLAAGTRVLDKDDNYVGGDLTITHSSKDDETTLYIWDYAAEDGDYVQVIVNGSAIGDPFMIKNKPVTYKVPTVGTIEVIGTRDGGGGITYGVYYEMNNTTYLNGMDEGNGNVYTLVRE